MRALPDEIVGDEAAMIAHAAEAARHFRASALLVLSRRRSIGFDKDGRRGGVREARPDGRVAPYMLVKGSKTPFLFRASEWQAEAREHVPGPPPDRAP